MLNKANDHKVPVIFFKITSSSLMGWSCAQGSISSYFWTKFFRLIELNFQPFLKQPYQKQWAYIHSRLKEGRLLLTERYTQELRKVDERYFELTFADCLPAKFFPKLLMPKWMRYTVKRWTKSCHSESLLWENHGLKFYIIIISSDGTTKKFSPVL